MGKKSKKGKTRQTQHHHGKAKRAAQVAKMRSNNNSNNTAASNTTTKPPATAAAPVAAAPVKIAVPTKDTNEADAPQATEPEIVQENAAAVEVPVVNSTKPPAVPQTSTSKPSPSNNKTQQQVQVTNPTTITTSKSESSMSSVPPELMGNLHLFSPSQAKLANKLCKPPMNQPHLFENWSTETTEHDGVKLDFMAQLVRMDKTYPSGGLVGYIKNARELLAKSKRGENPLEGWTPSVPDGEMFEIGTESYDKFEAVGLGEMGKCGFALVAGGLGERLGYGGIKLGLPTELATETTYLQYYIETILAIQSRYSNDLKLPLCIMVSNDTSAGTYKLLEDNNYFGMDAEQITIVQQGDGVPALMDNDATIAMHATDPYKIQAKPHGHGDIHALLHSHGVAKSWCSKGLEWVIFFQDTNGLAFHTLPLALGVSKTRNLIMNSIAVPRKGKQAVGGIAKLKKASTGEERTINVEYNQLDPLLRANGYPDGDVNDQKTGFSPFPGNINQLLFQLKPYTKAIERTKGAMPEFVNPKYADDAKTIFKKPTRLECMMQDFPTILNSEESKHVGFTSISADLCFSPVKNATQDGVKLQSKGTAPGVAATGEADQYAAVRKIMTSIGCKVEDAEPSVFQSIEVVAGPEIVLKPSFVVCPAEYKKHFPDPSKIKISSRSSLVIKGEGVTIESLDLDGALVIECEEGATGVIRNLVVKNKGWKKVIDESNASKEFIQIRGYHLEKVETKTIVFRKEEQMARKVEAVEKKDEPKTAAKIPTATKSRSTVAKTRATTTTAPSPVVKTEVKPVSPKINDAPDLNQPSPREATSTGPTCCCIC